MLDSELHDRESHDNADKRPWCRRRNPGPGGARGGVPAAAGGCSSRPRRVPSPRRSPSPRAPARPRRRGSAGNRRPGGIRTAGRDPRVRRPTSDGAGDDDDGTGTGRRRRRRSSRARGRTGDQDAAAEGTGAAPESQDSEPGQDAPAGAAGSGSRRSRRARGSGPAAPTAARARARRSSSRSRSRRPAKSGTGGDGTDAQADAPRGRGSGRRQRRPATPGRPTPTTTPRAAAAGGGASAAGVRPRTAPTLPAGRPAEHRRARARAERDDPPDDVRSVKGSTRLEAKKQRRREGRESGRRRPPIVTESEFLARRESVERTMVVRQRNDRTQIAVLEDGVLVEHYVNRSSHQSYVGNVYLGKVQNVLPSMEAAFVDIGKGRNAVLYAGEVNFDASGLEGQPKRIESALKSGQSVLVQVTKDPVGHKGARLTSQVSLPGRYLVYVPGASMTGISRKLPDTERNRLKQILKKVMPENAGRHRAHRGRGRRRGGAVPRRVPAAAQWEAIEKQVQDGQRARAALRRARPDHPRDQGRVQRGLQQAGGVRRRGLGRGRRVRQVRRPAPGRPAHPLAGRPRTRSPSTGSTSSWPRRSSARSGCPAAVRWSSTRPRP